MCSLSQVDSPGCLDTSKLACLKDTRRRKDIPSLQWDWVWNVTVGGRYILQCSDHNEAEVRKLWSGHGFCTDTMQNLGKS